MVRDTVSTVEQFKVRNNGRPQTIYLGPRHWGNCRSHNALWGCILDRSRGRPDATQYKSTAGALFVDLLYQSHDLE
jgi:hypothetical protein